MADQEEDIKSKRIRYNMDRLVKEALDKGPGNGGILEDLFYKNREANIKNLTARQVEVQDRAKRSKKPAPPADDDEAIGRKAEQLALKQMEDQALGFASGNIKIAENKDQANPMTGIATMAMGFLPFGGQITNAASQFGLGNVFGWIGKLFSVAWEWFTQKPDANGKKKSWGDIWANYDINEGLTGYTKGLGITDPKAAEAMVGELTKPMPSETAPATPAAQTPAPGASNDKKTDLQSDPRLLGTLTPKATPIVPANGKDQVMTLFG